MLKYQKTKNQKNKKNKKIKKTKKSKKSKIDSNKIYLLLPPVAQLSYVPYC
jgi:hypothetical protein